MTVELEDSDRLRSAGEERNLLAAALKSQEAWLQVADRITSEDFGFPVNRAIWHVVDHMRGQNLEPNPVDIFEKLPGDIRTQLEVMGGWGFIEGLREMPISTRNVEQYAKNVQNLTVLRRGRKAGMEITLAAEEATKADDFLSTVETIVNEIPSSVGDEVSLLGSIVDDFAAERAAITEEIPGLTTGFPLLDKSLQGLQPGRMYVIGARKKTGKSVILLNMVKHLAVDNHTPVLYISTEQTQRDEISRLLSLTAEVPEDFVGNGVAFRAMQHEAARLEHAKDRIREAPIYFAHDPFFTLEKLRRVVRKYTRLHGIQALFFDYIKIPTEAMASKDKWAQVGGLAYGLKAIASDENIPVITAVQINRDGARDLKYQGSVDSDSFANSDMIAQAMSVGLVFRHLSPKEVEEHPGWGFSEVTQRVLQVTDNRHGKAWYKALFDLNKDYVKLTEVETF